MPKTSIYLNNDDKSFCLGKGKNLSEGVRFCIAQERHRAFFIDTLRGLLQDIPKTSPEASYAVTEDLRKNILKLMED